MNDGAIAIGRPEMPAAQAVRRPRLPAWVARLLQLCLWVVVAVLALHFVRFCTAAAVRSSSGFISYYTAARLVWQGVPVSQFYDDEWFRAEVERYDPAIGDIYNPNPPTTTLMLVPLAGLDYLPARIVWTAINVVVWAGAVGWTLWRLQLRGPWLAGAIALALAYQPVYANLWNAQVYAVLLGLTVVVWEGYRCRRERMLGVALGTMILLKTAGIWLVPLLIVQRRWRALAWGLACIACVGLAALPWVSLDAWRTYLVLLPGISTGPARAVTAYQTQLSWARHLFTTDAVSNPAPIFSAPACVPWLIAAAALVLLGISTDRAVRGAQADRDFALFATIGLILSPVSLDYHYTLLFVPMLIVIARARRHPSPWKWLLLAAAIWLVAADLPYRSPALAVGPAALLAYPKLYGAWLLWAVAAWGGHRQARSRPGGGGDHPTVSRPPAPAAAAAVRPRTAGVGRRRR